MGGRRKNPSARVSAAPAAVLPANSMKKGRRRAEEPVDSPVNGKKQKKEVVREVPQQKEEKKKKLKKVSAKPPPKSPEETTLLESFSEETVARATKKLASTVLRKGSAGPASEKRNEEGNSVESESNFDGYEQEDNDVKMKDAQSAKFQQGDVVSERKRVKSPNRTQVSGSKILFVGNLSYTAEENDLWEFFKDAGEVVDVRVAAHEAGRRKGKTKGFGHVEFASEEEARKALELHGGELLGRPVKLDLACERVEYTPESGVLGKRHPGQPVNNPVNAKEQKKEVVKEVPQQKEEKKKRRKKKLNKLPAKPPLRKEQEIGGLEETTLLESFNEETISRGNKKLPSTVQRNGSASPASEERKEESNSVGSESDFHDYEEEDNDVKMKYAQSAKCQQSDIVSEKKGVENPTRTQVSRSKILFVGNLSCTAEQNDLREFFKDAGEVVDVRLAALDAGRRKRKTKGFGHVEFASEEEAQKALELNGEELLGRPLKLHLACERVECTPKSGMDNNSYQVGGNIQSQTVLLYGLDKLLDEDQIRSSLQEHFGSCGQMTRIFIPKDYDTRAPRGIAYINFKDKDGLLKALQLNGSHLCGYSLTVEHVGCGGVRRGGQDGGQRDGGGSFGSRGCRGHGGSGSGHHGSGCRNEDKPSKNQIPEQDRLRLVPIPMPVLAANQPIQDIRSDWFMPVSS